MLKLKVALLAGSILSATAAMAQTVAPAVTDSGGAAPVEGIAPAAPPPSAASEIIVTGIRGSLASAARIKRDANQIVDSITATDVGKFPDTNIAESLQRITGVAIDRSGGEGQFITVRGLGPQFNTVLVNGRVMATDNPGREFSFDVLSSNMIQRTDVYKSPQAELQEGGIGATVNIVTARPLDGKSGLHGALSSGGIYDTMRGKATPDFSGIASWANAEKTIGLPLSGSYKVGSYHVVP